MSGAGRDQRTGAPAEDQRHAQLLADLQRLLRDPINRGVTLPGLALVSGTQLVPHGLGRVPQGWFAVRVRGANGFYARELPPDPARPHDPRRFLRLELLLDCLVDLRVF